MAKRLLKRDIMIDAFISSPAKRARKTAEAFLKAYDGNKDQIIFIEDLYMAGPSSFEKVIKNTNDRYHTIAIFSHNEGITEFANSLTDTRTDNIPTCGVFAVRVKSRHWNDFADAKKEFWFFDYPKAEE